MGRGGKPHSGEANRIWHRSLTFAREFEQIVLPVPLDFGACFDSSTTHKRTLVSKMLQNRLIGEGTVAL